MTTAKLIVVFIIAWIFVTSVVYLAEQDLNRVQIVGGK